MRKETDLVDQVSNVHSHNIEGARQRLRPANGKQGILQDQTPDPLIPLLENLIVAVKKYPYAALSVMIGIASVVIASVTILAVSVIGGMFLMYGQMREMSATQSTILEQQHKTADEVVDTGKIMRAYEAANGRRTEFMVGLMSKENQQKMNEYDRTHPTPLIFGDGNEKGKQ